MRRIAGIAVSGILAIGLCGVPATAAQPQSLPGPIDEVMNQPVAVQSTMNVIVMLKKQPDGKLDAASGKASVAAVAKRWDGRNGIKVRRSFGLLVRGFSATVPVSMIDDMRKDPDIAAVEEMTVYEPSMRTSGELTKSIEAAQKRDLDGRGLLVSIIDSGIDIKHKDMRLDDGVPMKMQPQTGWTKKVPYGYNFADGNSNVKDAGSQHGQHVAGIVAANGTDAEVEAGDAIDGIAPNAQLLAMKVFSNAGGGAAEDDIIAAIEKSVELGADVINMSLGSPNGNTQRSIGEGRAIAEAAKAGVQVIVASGNDGLNFSKDGDLKDSSDLLDNGVMAKPASTNDAFAIASVNNSHSMSTQGSFNGNNFSYLYSVGKLDEQEHLIFDCGLGKPEEISEEVKGNWCLIQRGEINFAAKFDNAVAKGATGVVIWNNGPESFIGMGGLDAYKNTDTPVGISVFTSTGQAIKDSIAAGETKIKLSTRLVPTPVANAAKPSFFTSWGSTPTLEFKPQLAGIGGNVWSLANDNDYQEMSGTSMATPHVSGIFALGLQEYIKRYPQMSRQERGELLQIALSNTAQILKQDDGVPYSTRQIGAGLAQTETALQSQVFATVEGAPNVALKEIQGQKSFTITLQNKGEKAYTFKTDATCVGQEVRAEGQDMHMACSTTDKATAAAATVTVPAKGKATVTYTVTVDNATPHWVTGWALLNSEDASQPSLSMPFMGFAGDWNAEPILDPQTGSEGSGTLVKYGAYSSNVTTLMTTRADGMGTTLYGTDTYSLNWISPNGDGDRDTVYGSYAVLRSAKEIRYSVWSADGKTKLVDLGKDEDIQRYPIYKIAKAIGSHRSTSHAWDGTVYNSKTGKFETVPDGTYLYRAEACTGLDKRCQVLDQMVRTDTVAPEITITQRDGASSVILDIKGTDTGSGMSGVTGLTATDAQTGKNLTMPMGLSQKWSLSVPQGTKVINFVATDYAGNSTEKLYSLDGAAMLTFEGKGNFNKWINLRSTDASKKPLINSDGTVTLRLKADQSFEKATLTTKATALPKAQGQAAGEPKTSSQEITFKDGKATVSAKVIEGINEFTVSGTSGDGTQLSDTLTVKVDVSVPVIEITNEDEFLRDGLVQVDPAVGLVMIKGKVWDNRAVPVGQPDENGQIDYMNVITFLTITDGKLMPVPADIKEDGTFELIVQVAKGQSQIQVFVLDGFDLATSSYLNPAGFTYQVETDGAVASGESLTIVFGEDRFNGTAAEPFGTSMVLLDKTFKGLKVNADGTGVVTLNGSFNRAPGEFKINGKTVPLTNGRVFKVDVPIKEGINNISYAVIDTDGTEVAAFMWKWLWDKTLPSYELEATPQIARDGAIWLNDSNVNQKATLKGTVWDNAFGYSFKINGNVVADFESIWDPGEKVNKREYTTELKIEDGDLINLGLFDTVGNGMERVIPVHFDNEAPVVTIDGLTGNTPINSNTKITIKATDQHLDKLIVQVDGQPVVATLAEVAKDPKATVKEINIGDPSQPAITVGDAKVGQTELVYVIDTPLKTGKHTVTATAIDLAGNESTTMGTYVINQAPVIVGPDKIKVSPHNGVLTRQLAKIYKVTDETDKNLKVKVDVTDVWPDRWSPAVLSATDSSGNTTTRKVMVC